MIVQRAASLLQRLTTPFGVDDYLSALHPLWGTRTRGVVTSVTPRGTGASVRIRPGAGWAGHRPGQFVTLGVDVEGVRHHRCFTLTSAPGEPTIEVTVQATPDGVVSRHLATRTVPGEVVQLSPAAGGVDVVDRRPGSPLLFVTGGSGVTPAVGILWSLDSAGVRIDAVVLHHSASPARALFTEELDALARRHRGIRVDHSLSQPDGSHRLDADGLGRRCPDWRERSAVVCGPQPMLDVAEAIWSDAGLRDRLHLERFHPVAPGVPRGAADAGPAGTAPLAWFATSDVVAAVPPGATLLDVAEAAGLAPPSGCRMGICHTCTTPLTSGSATDLRDGRERCAGDRVQLCVSTAADDVVLDL